MLAVLCGFTALSIDVGLTYVERRDAQTASDAAALAGAKLILDGRTIGAATAEAEEWLEKNGFATEDVEWEINIPPASGPHAGDSDFVEVLVNTEVEAGFARALGWETFPVSARAVAGVENGNGAYSIIVLNESDCEAMDFDGNVSINITNGATFTNSNCPSNAFSAVGSVDVNTDGNYVVGGWEVGGASNVSPEPSPATTIEDPLKDVPVPIPPSEPVRSCPSFSGPPGTTVLEPGVYDCFIDPSGSWDVEFLPGDYHITGGVRMNGNNDFVFGAGIYTLGGVGLQMTGNGTVEAESVMFYIDEGEVDLSGSGSMHLTAPESGTYEGLSIFQNRSLTSTVRMRGAALADGWGAVYAVAAEADIAGTADTSFQFIVDTMWVHGNSTIAFDFNNFEASAGTLRLVE